MKEFFKFTFASMLGTFIAGLVLVFVIGVLVIGSIISSANELTEQKEVTVKEHSVLHLTLNKAIAEHGGEDFDIPLPPLYDLSEIDALDDVLMSIEKAGKDSKIDGIYLDLSYIPAGWATLREIRDALIDFKKSKKWIVAYGQVFTEGAYYLSTVADKVYMHPEGGLEFSGIGGNITFYKNAADKYGIEMQVIRGKNNQFKSAVEPYLYDKMSDANRLQTERYLKGVWNVVLEDIAASRKLSADSLNLIADNLSISSTADAVTLGLIDGLKYKDEMETELARVAKVTSYDDLEMVSFRRYKKTIAKGTGDYKKEKIAVIYAEGAIIDGKAPKGSIGGDNLSEEIRKARKDSKVKAVVLRVNSPGGSALASDVIWREVELCKKVKPVVVSFGDVAASGGYYISAGANKIFAQPNTITGSIGVFGVLPNAKKLANDLGVTFDGVKTNKHADMGSPWRALDPEEYLLIQKSVDQVYDKFLTVVSKGRNKTKEAVDSIGQGRVWVATDALELGLVDAIGGVDEAIAEAAKMAKLGDYRVVRLPETEDFFKRLMNEISGEQIQARIIKNHMSQFPELYRQFEQIQTIAKTSGVQMRLPYLIDISK
ncbi:MAG TPA: signal peptide peptidase SppA [Luteibaculaceae bacterium]|nr:signal peptide peptidase SppA [Luteibaculaceae bacterium]